MCYSDQIGFARYIFVIVNVPLVQPEDPVAKLNVPLAMLPR
jgi:hypothetical protein